MATQTNNGDIASRIYTSLKQYRDKVLVADKEYDDYRDADKMDAVEQLLKNLKCVPSEDSPYLLKWVKGVSNLLYNRYSEELLLSWKGLAEYKAWVNSLDPEAGEGEPGIERVDDDLDERPAQPDGSPACLSESDYFDSRSLLSDTQSTLPGTMPADANGKQGHVRHTPGEEHPTRAPSAQSSSGTT